MRERIAFILENLSYLLLLTSYPIVFICKSDFFYQYYAVATSAGCSLLLFSNAIYRKDWGVVPIGIMLIFLSMFFLIDFSFLDDFVKTKVAGVIIIITSFICYAWVTFIRLRKWILYH
jgi:hypothetical protein